MGGCRPAEGEPLQGEWDNLCLLLRTLSQRGEWWPEEILPSCAFFDAKSRPSLPQLVAVAQVR